MIRSTAKLEVGLKLKTIHSYLDIDLGFADAVTLRDGVPVHRGVLIPPEPGADGIRDGERQLVVGNRRSLCKRARRAPIERLDNLHRKSVVLQVSGGSEGTSTGDMLRSGNQRTLGDSPGQATDLFQNPEPGSGVVDAAEEGTLDDPEDSDVVGARQVAHGPVGGQIAIALYYCVPREVLYLGTGWLVVAIPVHMHVNTCHAEDSGIGLHARSLAIALYLSHVS